MRVEFSSFVETDLDSIAAFIARDNPARAVSFIREIRSELRRIAQNPNLFQLRPDIGDDARVAVFGHYIILFRILNRTRGDILRIERIVYGGRDLPALL